MTYKKITNPDELIVGRLYTDIKPTSKGASIMKFEGNDKKNKLKFKCLKNCEFYGCKKLRFDNPEAMPFYELPQDFELSHLGTTNPTDFPIQ
jgi:hypothetical protein